MTRQIDLAARLDDLLEVPDRRDWLDVERRARRRRVPRGRTARLLLIAAVATAIGAPIAAALGVREGVIAIGGSSDHVPRSVHRQFDMIAHDPKDVGGPPQSWPWRGIVPSTTRRAAAFQLADGRTASIYAAGTREGEVCWSTVVTGISGNGGSCAPTSGSTRGLAAVDLTSSGGLPSILLFAAGYVRFAAATSVRIEYEDGSQQTAPVQSHWTAFEIASAHGMAGHRPTSISALAANGRVLSTQRDPFPNLLPAPKPETPTRPSIRLLQTTPVPVGGRVYLAEGTTAAGVRCTRVLRIGRSRFGGNWDGGWECGPEVGARFVGHPLTWGAGVESGFATGLGWVYYYGWVGPEVGAVRVRFQDHTSTKIRLRDRYFLYVVSRSRFTLGRRPASVVVYDHAGARIETNGLYPRRRCWYPSRDPVCKTYQVANG